MNTPPPSVESVEFEGLGGWYFDDNQAASIWGAPTMDVEPDLHSFSAPPQVDSPVGILNTPGDQLDPDDVAARVGTRARLNGKAFFLTYSQSKLSRDALTRFYARQSRVLRVIVGMEHHQDGNTHWHVLIEYEHVKDVRRMTYFDIEGEHPNIKVWSRSGGSTFDQWVSNHYEYCRKEDPTPWMLGPEPMEKTGKRDTKFLNALQLASRHGVKEALFFLQENAAYDLVTKYDQIVRALTAYRNEHCRPTTPARALCLFPHVPLIVDNWRNLYINGPTGCGKTQWARALLPEAIVVRHRDQLRGCDFSKGVIFDDFDVAHWPPTAVIHLLDWDEGSGIDVKHGHVIIPEHTRKIFTHNCSFDRWLSKDASEEQIAACKRRVHVVNITRRLF